MTKEERQDLIDIAAEVFAIHGRLSYLINESQEAESAKIDAEPEPEGPTLDDVRAKVGEAIMALSPEVVQGVFVNYKVAKVSQFAPEQYGNLIETLDEMIKEAGNESKD